MTDQPVNHVIARHGVHPPDWRRIVRILTFVVLLPVTLPTSCALYNNLVPAYAGSFHAAETDTTIEIRLYRLWFDSPGDRGVTIRVRSPRGDTTHRLCGVYWGEFGARTEVYLTDQRTIAINGNSECVRFVSPELIVTSIQRSRPEGWRYLGAFDVVPGRSPGTRELRFIPASE